jgi:serine/threonine protein kinase
LGPAPQKSRISSTPCPSSSHPLNAKELRGFWGNRTIDPSSYYIYEELFDKMTTLMYRPPEMCDCYQRPYVSEKVDIWMLGCIIFTLAFYRHPFYESTKLMIMSVSYTIPDDSKYSEKFHDLITLLLTPNPGLRPSIHETLKILESYSHLPSIPLNVRECERRLFRGKERFCGKQEQAREIKLKREQRFKALSQSNSGLGNKSGDVFANMNFSGVSRLGRPGRINQVSSFVSQPRTVSHAEQQAPINSFPQAAPYQTLYWDGFSFNQAPNSAGLPNKQKAQNAFSGFGINKMESNAAVQGMIVPGFEDFAFDQPKLGATTSNPNNNFWEASGTLSSNSKRQGSYGGSFWDQPSNKSPNLGGRNEAKAMEEVDILGAGFPQRAPEVYKEAPKFEESLLDLHLGGGGQANTAPAQTFVQLTMSMPVKSQGFNSHVNVAAASKEKKDESLLDLVF